MEFSQALREGAIHIPRELFTILNEVFNIEKPLASGLAVASNMDLRDVEKAISARNYLFHDTRYLLTDSPDIPETVLWMKTVYVYTGGEQLVKKNIARPRVIDPMPCRRLYGDPVALDELVVCASLRPLVGREVFFKTFIFKTRKKIIDIDVEGLCRGITSYARRAGGVAVYLPVLLRREVENVARLLQARGVDPEFLRSGDVDPVRDLVDKVIAESKRLSGLA